VLRKNIRLVGGQPLIAYSIQAAMKCRFLTDFIVSTDDDEISEVAKKYNAKVIKRPAELASDDTPMLPVIQHAIGLLEKDDDNIKYGVILQPTAPLRTASDIERAIEILFDSKADSVISVYQVTDAHPARMYRIVNDRLLPYEAEPSARLRQKLPPVYHRNGAIYAFRREIIETQATLIGENTFPYVMPRERSINIDDELDLLFADYLLRSQMHKEG
jgi:CMP-N,N'-diacetyllegionaminic acid synthase